MYRTIFTQLCVVHGLIAVFGLSVSRAAADSGYANYETLTGSLNELSGTHPDACTLVSFGTSREGRELWALELGRGDDRADRLAMVIAAGIDGNNPATTATAVSVAQSLLSAKEGEPGWKLLADHTVFVLPRVNPDAMESFFADPRHEQRVALRPWDDDRDGLVDEDGPEDLNGDGLITMMRVPLENRAISDLEATHLPDPLEPRLLKAADAAKGEKAIYAFLVEGIDNDGDKEYNEDGRGGVDLNRNFMHEYKEHDSGTGPHQLSEPESKALIDFFLEHPHIAIAVFYGRHDNIVEVAGDEKARGRGKGRGSGEDDGGGGMMRFRRRPRGPDKAPTGLHKDDVSIYKQISEKYREITGLKKMPREPADGAVFAWTYAQYGIPAFACRIWARPEPEGDKKDKGAGASDDAKPGREDTEAATAPPGEADERSEPDATTIQGHDDHADAHEDGGSSEEKAKPKGDPRTEGKKEDDKKPADPEAAAWLKYSDEQCDGSGFVAWTSFDHPQLGEVEIGGFAPFFRTTPPPAAFDEIAEKQLSFVLDLAARFPNVSLARPKITRLSDTVYEIETAIVNDGYFPSGLAIAKVNRRVRPIVITLEVEPARVLGGQRVEKIWSVAGSGGRHRLRWVVQGEPGSTITIKMSSEKWGDGQLEVMLAATEEEGSGS